MTWLKIHRINALALGVKGLSDHRIILIWSRSGTVSPGTSVLFPVEEVEAEGVHEAEADQVPAPGLLAVLGIYHAILYAFQIKLWI